MNKVFVGIFPSESCEEEPIPWLSPSFWCFASYLLCSLACRSIALTSAFIFTWHSPCADAWNFPFYKDINHIELGIQATPLWLQYKLWYLQQTYFQVRLYSEVVEVKTSAYEFCGDTIWSITNCVTVTFCHITKPSII